MMYKKVYLNILHHNNLFFPKDFSAVTVERPAFFTNREEGTHYIFAEFTRFYSIKSHSSLHVHTFTFPIMLHSVVLLTSVTVSRSYLRLVFDANHFL